MTTWRSVAERAKLRAQVSQPSGLTPATVRAVIEAGRGRATENTPPPSVHPRPSSLPMIPGHNRLEIPGARSGAAFDPWRSPAVRPQLEPAPLRDTAAEIIAADRARPASGYVPRMAELVRRTGRITTPEKRRAVEELKRVTLAERARRGPATRVRQGVGIAPVDIARGVLVPWKGRVTRLRPVDRRVPANRREVPPEASDEVRELRPIASGGHLVKPAPRPRPPATDAPAPAGVAAELADSTRDAFAGSALDAAPAAPAVTPEDGALSWAFLGGAVLVAWFLFGRSSS